MKVLLSAIACNPYEGSESYFGWSAVKCLACEHDLCVITSTRNRPGLEKAQGEGLVPTNVRFAYAGAIKDWHPNRLLARIQSWKEYVGFSRDSLSVARELHQTEKFDVVHHVTYSTWRVASPMWQLGIPFVFGPLGGSEAFPFRLYPVLSLSGAAFETARKLSNALSPYFPQVRRSVQKADHIFVHTEETEQLMIKMRGSDRNLSRLSAGFYSAERAAAFSRFVPRKDPTGILRLYVAGNLGSHKSVSIAFQALGLVKRRGIDFRYHLGAGGPEIPYLKGLAKKLNLTKEIIFGDTTTQELYQQELGRTHIYLLPSMRETVGLTGLEAMLAGCVPIVADKGGPRVTVTENCGYKIPVASARRMAEAIADVIEKIERNRQIIVEKGQLASTRVMEVHSEENYVRNVGEVYRALVERKRAQ